MSYVKTMWPKTLKGENQVFIYVVVFVFVFVFYLGFYMTLFVVFRWVEDHVGKGLGDK